MRLVLGVWLLERMECLVLVDNHVGERHRLQDLYHRLVSRLLNLVSIHHLIGHIGLHLIDHILRLIPQILLQLPYNNHLYLLIFLNSLVISY